MSGLSEGLWTHEEYCSALEEEVRRFAGVVEGVDPETPVTTCPGWVVAKLLKHVGIIYRWAEHIVRERAEKPVAFREVPVALPEDAAGYPVWLAEGGEALVATLRAAGGEAPVWSWGAERNAGFWARRMLHESTVHRADAEITLGREPRIEVPVAVDGVEEALDNLLAAERFAEGFAELSRGGERLHFHATDAGEAGEWTVTLASGGFTWERGHGKGDVAVRATAADLLLMLYGRREPVGERYEVFGDRALLDAWRAKTKF
ncbi:maleylpyruvate isomerase family mycothiol-dependent enzyme [Sphaerisporangium dianthi]|uniref:Maleylpyruvate isomerase family mycothiol-dependent enzyme n=1 Tax=Sphaerisporangium dianthi TaxID=1436120 RepID=A0ABV9CEM7_9ACTN